VNFSDVLLVRLPLAVWVGATVLVGAAAPVIFRTIPSRDLAGMVFGSILRKLESLQHGLSAVLVIGIFHAVGREGQIAGRSAVTAIGSFLAIATNVYLSMVLRPKMTYYRGQAGSFDEIPEENPWRKKFNVLHRRATRVTGLGLVCAATALFFAP
jgi:hypothetical protein